jgi:hypothetical protein
MACSWSRPGCEPAEFAVYSPQIEHNRASENPCGDPVLSVWPQPSALPCRLWHGPAAGHVAQARNAPRCAPSPRQTLPRVVTVSTQASPLAVPRSIRPQLRGADAKAHPCATPACRTAAADRQRRRDSPTGCAAFRPARAAAGIGRPRWISAFSGVSVLPRVLERDRNQAEFSRALWDYLDSAVSDTRVANGRTALAEHRDPDPDRTPLRGRGRGCGGDLGP